MAVCVYLCVSVCVNGKEGEKGDEIRCFKSLKIDGL